MKKSKFLLLGSVASLASIPFVAAKCGETKEEKKLEADKPDQGTPTNPDQGTPANPDQGTPTNPGQGTPANPHFSPEEENAEKLIREALMRRSKKQQQN